MNGPSAKTIIRILATVNLWSLWATAALAQSSFRVDTIAVIPVGAAEDQIGTTVCEECGDCATGFAFFDASEANLYLYDYTRANLKRVPLHGRQRSSVASIVPGVRTEYVNDRPTDGAIAGDGTIVLLGDTGRREGRYRLYLRAPPDTQWTQTERFDEPSVGIGSLFGRTVMAPGSVRVSLPRPGEVVVFQDSPRPMPGRLVFRSGSLVPLSERAEVSPTAYKSGRHFDRRVASGIHAGVAPRFSAAERTMNAEYLGSDAKGRRYYLTIRAAAGPPWFDLEAYSAAGALLARQPWSEPLQECQLIGRGRKFVTADGKVLIIQTISTQLQVISFSVEGG